MKTAQALTRIARRRSSRGLVVVHNIQHEHNSDGVCRLFSPTLYACFFLLFFDFFFSEWRRRLLEPSPPSLSSAGRFVDFAPRTDTMVGVLPFFAVRFKASSQSASSPPTAYLPRSTTA